MTALGIGIASLALMVVLIIAGLHVAISLLLLSFVGVWLMRDSIDVALALMAQATSDSIASHEFGVVPLFVLMGLLVATADLGKDIFEVANSMLRRIRGGLGVATVMANAVFAAITGISIASAAVFTKVAVPEMLRFGFTPRFATGVVAGSSVLGMLIPPSLLMILYAFLSEQSVGAMFLAGVMPGLLLAVAFSIAIVAMAWLFPGYVGGTAAVNVPGMGLSEAAFKVAPVVLLIFVVLGGIYGGIFTATDAGAVGALGALALALAKRRLTPSIFWKVLVETGRITVSVLFLIIAANLYSRMLTLSGLPQFIVEWMAGLGFGVAGFLAVFIAIVLFLGCIIDSASIMLIVLPLMLPVAKTLGIDLVWFGVITVVAVEIGLLTPPFGISVYVVKSTLNDARITLWDIFAGTQPFTLIMFAVLLLIIAFPGIALFFN
ncbi:TRAP transporter large permease subunit [Reyranella aquatilis]|uniref:TRAP transporter large permease protein n=1 Tax=Reyranella aquatilis TaxID=2035356 RepID=A0ABS8KTM5_9HYPH|nr:TRAP transporter large permease subunit [Reyranella aquatilis]MCC8429410.1 TRAP transporter large permease subunit [Reyranella aquatilis]